MTKVQIMTPSIRMKTCIAFKPALLTELFADVVKPDPLLSSAELDPGSWHLF